VFGEVPAGASGGALLPMKDVFQMNAGARLQSEPRARAVCS